MADRNKFEEMLERLINEDKEGAEELFHEIVVEKSRDIYETLLADEAEEDDEDVEESSKEDEKDEEVEEGFDLDEFEVAPMEVGGDETDDLEMDVDMGGDEEGGDMDMDMDGGDEEEGDTDERLSDLEDALDELKAEFEKLMAGEEGGEEEEGDDEEEGEEGDDEEGEDKMPFEAEEKEEDKNGDGKDDKTGKPMKKSDSETMREYVEKVTAKMGDTGTNGTKSAVAGKNDMGGTTANIAKGATGSEKGTGAKAPKEDSAGNVNVPGGKASKLSSVSKPKMGDTGTNGTKSIIGQ